MQNNSNHSPDTLPERYQKTEIAAEEVTPRQVEYQSPGAVEPEKYIERELILLKLEVKGKKRAEALKVAAAFRCAVVHLGETTVILECTGNEQKLTALEQTMKPYGLKQAARTGMISMTRR